MSTPAADGSLLASVLWRRLDVAGAEYCSLRETADGPRLEGTIVLADDGLPLRIDYEVACSESWETRRVNISMVRGDSRRRLEFSVDEERRWRANGAELAGLAGQVDVDLNLTPATNTLPFRRLRFGELSPGESREVTAAWLVFPAMRLEPLAQRYTALGAGRFHYETLDGEFVSELEFDDLGMIVRYPPLWERVAEFRATGKKRRERLDEVQAHRLARQ